MLKGTLTTEKEPFAEAKRREKKKDGSTVIGLIATF